MHLCKHADIRYIRFHPSYSVPCGVARTAEARLPLPAARLVDDPAGALRFNGGGWTCAALRSCVASRIARLTSLYLRCPGFFKFPVNIFNPARS